MPSFIPRLMREIYTALHGDCLSLAAMGVRALLESVMIHRVTDDGTFQKNLCDFERQGHITLNQRGVLGATLEAGHASIHRDYAPSHDDLMLVQCNVDS